MRRKRGPGISDSEKSEIWRRWQIGMSLSEIGRVIGRSHAQVHRVVSASGGVMPPPRRRSRLALSWAEREEISRGIVAGHSMRTIAAILKRAPSTVSREIARHGGRETYRANTADETAWDYARRPKGPRNNKSSQLVANVPLQGGAGRRADHEYSTSSVDRVRFEVVRSIAFV